MNEISYDIVSYVKESIFDSSKQSLETLVSNFVENGMDCVLDNEALKCIPIVNIVGYICKVSVAIRERNLLRQFICFLKSFNSGDISQEELDEHNEKLKDPKYKEQELGRVLFILDQTIDDIKSEITGSFYLYYVKKTIDWNQFCELTEVNNRMMIPDYRILLALAHKEKGFKIPDKEMYKLDRLQSLGLVFDKGPIIKHGTLILSSNSPDYISPLGTTFVNLMGKAAFDIQQ